MRYAPLILLAVFAVGGSTTTPDRAPTTSESPATVEEIARTYHQLSSMTKEPVFVDPSLASLCRGADQKEVEASRKVSGPHAYTMVSIYMNAPAATAFQQKGAAYPIGSIIVKEKKGMGYYAADERIPTTQTSDGVGGMIKRPPGFDPAHSDWEYFYFTDPAKVESGKIASCVQCHSTAAAKDYVFGGWAGADRVK